MSKYFPVFSSILLTHKGSHREASKPGGRNERERLRNYKKDMKKRRKKPELDEEKDTENNDEKNRRRD